MATGYLELKLAWELFDRAPEDLATDERTCLEQVARKQCVIERCILASPEAAGVLVPPATLAARLAEIAKRYPSAADHQADLERYGLTPDILAAAVTRDIHVEAVLEKIAATAPQASEVDAEIYFRLNPAAFNRPEMRELRHILITYGNDQEKAAATVLLTSLRSALVTPEAFAAAALRHSQCPTAMEGGKLGTVKPGQLFPELEPHAFSLAAGNISAVAESPIGLHILRCDRIHPPASLDFTEVCPQIIHHLTDSRRQQTQREWIKGLLAEDNRIRHSRLTS